MEYFKRNFILLIHVGFWVVYFGLSVSILSRIFSETDMMFVTATVNLIGTMPLVYIFLFYLIPKFWDTKKYIVFVIGVIVVTVVSALFRYYTLAIVAGMLQENQSAFYEEQIFFQFLVGGFFILFVATPLRIIDVYLKKMRLENQLKTHKLEAELRFLKAQVNPHFLFNALNNIYSLSFTQSKQAPEMILKLSDMMSFMLYDCKEEKVNLASEIEYLKNYISLQQLKKEGEQKITLEVEGNPEGIYITPMLFIPFYENAFKHGNVDDPEKGYLNSKFLIEEGKLIFTIINSLSENKKEYAKGGVGLENIESRLNLLYKDKHQLSIKPLTNTYEVVLQLDLNNFNEQ